jgi:hypothetical protein
MSPHAQELRAHSVALFAAIADIHGITLQFSESKCVSLFAFEPLAREALCVRAACEAKL